jgi:Domain of unknown function (DUF3846)
MTSKWLTVEPDGTVTERDDDPTLETMQEVVQGNLEAIASPEEGVSVFVNEEKKDWRSGQPLLLNAKATGYLRDMLWPGTRIVGKMILAGAPDPTDEDGNLQPLTSEQVASLMERLA